MRFPTVMILALIAGLQVSVIATQFDAAPFALALPGADGQGLVWEDPREVHRVTVQFATPPPADVRLEYWGSRWPEQRLPKDKEPGGGSVGWMELGNWYTYQWRTADAEISRAGNAVTFTFNPVNRKEFPAIKEYAADFRYTLKLRVAGAGALPRVEWFEAWTDSKVEAGAFQLAWKSGKAPAGQQISAFNGRIVGVSNDVCRLEKVANADPNTFDRTLVTVSNRTGVFTFRMDDLESGPLVIPHLGVAVAKGSGRANYEQLRAQASSGAKTLYDRVSGMPEQTWQAAWTGMPPKKSHIYLPIGLDGGRQRFRLDADGTVRFRSNDGYLRHPAGKETERLDLEPASVRFRFLPPLVSEARSIAEAALPICETIWQTNGVRIVQTALATPISGTESTGPVPAADTLTVLMARFIFTNATASPQTLTLPVSYKAGEAAAALRQGETGLLLLGNHVRAQWSGEGAPKVEGETMNWTVQLEPGASKTVIFKIPYLVLGKGEEVELLKKLDFARELAAVSDYWRRRLDASARLITPEPMLNEFYRAHAGHLLINCEREPGAERRFARVGSFSYGAYGNESCMMVVDLERRGYHREAQECLDGWLKYQGSAKLPGDFSTQEGVLYGAAGLEAGGYNQHHGWILWMLAEHYRYTRDEGWLRKAAPGILAGADWIIQETARTADRHPLERGLLPAGRLEDIEDWWTWLSTSCYSWRGLDSAAWALEQIRDPQAARVRTAATAYHTALVGNFRAASERSPVVRLRDGTAVPHIPSMVHRRGRSFGWICETLEGSMHLLITGALDCRSPEAEWIIRDYEDNRYLSNQYGYVLEDFERDWFGRGGMSMQACLFLDVEPYLYRDEPKHALRALFNAQAVSYFPDERMNTEHALPAMGDWAGDHYKSSDESNSAGWLRYLFVREEGHTLLIGQAVPREWLGPGKRCGMENTATWFGKTSILYTGSAGSVTAKLSGPTRNPPEKIRLRIRTPGEKAIKSVTVSGKRWPTPQGEWIELPGKVGEAEIVARYQ